MIYQFSPIIQAGILAGKYVPVTSLSGIPLSMVRNAETGRIVAHAIGVASQGSTLLNPLTAGPQLLMGAGQMYQNQMILQSVRALSTSLATLQATTAVIGVGVAATAVLSAVNLWQTLKLRQDIKEARVEIKEGFADLTQALADQGAEIIRHVQQVSEDVEFKNHRTILARAYGRFDKALNRLSSAVTIQDQSLRFDDITAARNTLFDALADYTNDQILSDVSSAAYLRRRECVWAIEQAIAMTYQLQGEYATVNGRLLELNGTVRNDAVKAVELVQEESEIDFLYPELLRIHDHDLVAINAWQAHADWYQSLPSEELKLLKESASNSDADTNTMLLEASTDEMPSEYQTYQEAQQQSHFEALQNSLIYLMLPEQRKEPEQYVSQQAKLEGLRALSEENLSKASPLALANLESYFYLQENLSQVDEGVTA